MMTRLVMLLALCATGCAGSAQIIHQNQSGGTLALDGDEDKALEDARKKMTAHCGPVGYQVVGRERVVVGQEEYSRSYEDFEEAEDRQKDSSTVATSTTDSEYGYDHDRAEAGSDSEYDDGYGNREGYQERIESESGEGYASEESTATSDTVEDESTVRQGSAQAETVTGVREVYEYRILYRCGR